MTGITKNHELRPVTPRHLERLNRFIYCHHCHEVTEMVVLGRQWGGAIIYRCPCGSEVRIVVAKG